MKNKQRKIKEKHKKPKVNPTPCIRIILTEID